jgi:hypothetical protein
MGDGVKMWESAKRASLVITMMLMGYTAHADSVIPVSMDFNGVGYGQNVTVQVQFLGSSTYSTVSGRAGVYKWSGIAGNPWPLNHNFESFCIDLKQVVNTSTTQTFTLKALENAPDPDPNPSTSVTGMGVDRANMLRRLWAAHRTDVVSDITATAFQIAIWEIVFERKPNYDDAPDYFDVRSAYGSFYLDTHTANYSSITYKANLWLQDALNENGRMEPMLMALSSPTFQDQLVVMPVPASAFGGTMLLGVLAGLRKPRRKSVA